MSVSRGPYSVSGIERILREKEEQLTRCHQELLEHRSIIAGTERFIFELIRRAEDKRQLTSRDSSALDLELDVLHRVLRRLQDAE